MPEKQKRNQTFCMEFFTNTFLCGLSVLILWPLLGVLLLLAIPN